MIAINKERGTGRVVFTTHGELDDATVAALLDALEQTDEEAPIVIDLCDAGPLTTSQDLRLMSTLAFRSGKVAFRGARREHRDLVRVARSA